ncbi:hypothetical protein LR48_Vigan07g130700 [Vigna angularis]|uniref:Uncharacterized protein n=1 Tax=Phaseolus angularis TaxID=3914 RepID=A0A0L9UXV6_PHAAN|nr:hypothetical protein LR48_Vigan07g130700 [Vigna angularis]
MESEKDIKSAKEEKNQVPLRGRSAAEEWNRGHAITVERYFTAERHSDGLGLTFLLILNYEFIQFLAFLVISSEVQELKGNQYAIGRNSLDLDFPKIRPKPKIMPLSGKLPLSGKCVSWFPPLSGLCTHQQSQRGFLSAAQRARSRVYCRGKEAVL